MDEQLKALPNIANDMFSDVVAGPQLKQKILSRAEDKKVIRFRPLRAIPALCCAAALVVACAFGIPSLLAPAQPDALIDSQPAGIPTGPATTTRADVPEGSLSVTTERKIPSFKNIFARASGSYFPLIQVDGETYRMLSTPGNLSSKLQGDSLGAVSTYTSEPSLSTGGIVSNVVLEGENVYAVKNMSGVMVTANVDGKMRVFQRASFGDSATASGETLADTLNADTVSEMTLSGVGVISDPEVAKSLYDTLTANASYLSGSVSDFSQSLLIKLRSGLTLQLGVDGDTLMACGSWSCPDFFEAFQSALEQ